MSDGFSRRATFGPVQRLKRRTVLKLSAIAGGASLAPWLIACGSSNNNKGATATQAPSQAATQAAAAGSPAAGAPAASASAAAQPAGTSAPAASNKAPSGQAVILQGADVNFMDPEFRNS